MRPRKIHAEDDLRTMAPKNRRENPLKRKVYHDRLDDNTPNPEVSSGRNLLVKPIWAAVTDVVTRISLVQRAIRIALEDEKHKGIEEKTKGDDSASRARTQVLLKLFAATEIMKDEALEAQGLARDGQDTKTRDDLKNALQKLSEVAVKMRNESTKNFLEIWDSSKKKLDVPHLHNALVELEPAVEKFETQDMKAFVNSLLKAFEQYSAGRAQQRDRAASVDVFASLSNELVMSQLMAAVRQLKRSAKR